MSTLPALTLAAAGIGLGHAALPDHWMPLAVLARARGYSQRRVLRLSAGAAAAHVAVSLALGGVVVLVGMGLRDSVARHADLVVGGVLVLTGVVLLALEAMGRGHGHDHSHEPEDHDHARAPHSHADHAHPHTGHAHPHPHPHVDHGHTTLAHTPPAADDRRETATALLERPAQPIASDRADAVADHARAAEPDHAHAQPASLGFLAAFGAAASPDLTILPVFLAAGSLGPASAVSTLTAFAVATVATVVGLTAVAAHGARRLTAPWSDRAANVLAATTLVAVGALVAAGVL